MVGWAEWITWEAVSAAPWKLRWHFAAYNAPWESEVLSDGKGGGIKWCC